ncbi:P-loop containing nucleoside triphosphate hydrolase protein [Hymenopellis radicata]|nr:P-loop containing nucleoside triphosphate hydrolase protein [Hymenopellis radicata]
MDMQQFMNLQILQGMRPLIDGTRAAMNVTATVSPLPEILTSLPVPPEVTSFISRLYSTSALRDWLIIATIGWLVDSCRWIFAWLRVEFWRLRTFDSNEPCHKWMMVWLSNQPGWANSRKIRFSREAASVSSSALGPYRADDNNAIRDLRFIPQTGFTYSCWFKNHYLTVGRTAPTYRGQYNTAASGGAFETSPNAYFGTPGPALNICADLHVSVIARNPSIILDLLREAQKAYAATLLIGTNVYTSTVGGDPWSPQSGRWNLTSFNPKRSFDSIILDPAVKDLVLKDAISFLSSKAWYFKRSIPFRRGYLLYGPPGSGKTSFISAIAGELGLDIYVVSLSQGGLDDAGLSRLFNALPGNCIALIEDIDAAFSATLNRDNEEGHSSPNMMAWPGQSGCSRVSLSGILNALDGIGAQEGRILFATTNKYESLDKALSRPGRMDLHIEFKLAAKYQARELFMRFYNPSDPGRMGSDLVDDSAKYDKESLASDDSGYASSHTQSSLESLALPSSVTFIGKLHTTQGPQLSQRRFVELADTFAEGIPDHEFSMASIQGYLMWHKTDPVAAVAGIKDWVCDAQSDVSDSTNRRNGLTCQGIQRSGRVFNPPRLLPPYHC